jgi:Flp pilus assembly protein TadG
MHKRESGQAIVLVAVALIVIFAVAALAIDLGNLYTERREAQNAADAASMAGARQVILECNNGAGASEAAIRNQALQMVQANNPNATAQVFYIDLAGSRPYASEVGGVGFVPCACGGNRAQGIEVVVTGQTQTFFANIIGRENLSAQARARASFNVVSVVSSGLYPFTRRNLPLTYNDIVTLRILDDADTLPGNFGWLTWNGENNTPNLCESLTPPGDCQIKYYNPGTPDNGWTPDYADKQIAIGKWVQGATGNMNANDVRGWLDWHIANHTAMAIPLYDTVVGEGSHSNYRVGSFAAFELQSYDFGGQNKSMTGRFLRTVVPGDWAPPVACGAEGGVYSVKLIP